MVNIPKGLEIGPDGKPCKVCSSFKSWTKQQSKSQQPSNDNSNNTSTLRKIVNVSLGDKFGCPVDGDELGRQTWTFLHTTASYYPRAPSNTQQNSMRSLIESISTFYPCGDCASHLRSYISIHPPQVHSRSSLELWMCQMHNEVNLRLGKDEFDCNRVGERWRDGWNDKSCD